MTGKAKGTDRAWQVGVWNSMAAGYEGAIDGRFVPVVGGVLARAEIKPGHQVLDLGTGTGSVALAAAEQVGPTGRVTGVDISREMLAKARGRARQRSCTNIDFKEGAAEAIPASAESQDTILASLSMMYVIDRAAAAREVARVLRRGGRFVAAVWAGPDTCDIVRFQQLAGSFAPKPPVDGVGPGSLADPAAFIQQLSQAGLVPVVESETTIFQFPDFASAWDPLAGVTTTALEPGAVAEAKRAVQAKMWPDPTKPRDFRNETQFIIAAKPA